MAKVGSALRVEEMKLLSVRVQDFKCIHDTEDFEVGEVTCLVGKNESGKTALLQALYKLNPIVPSHGSFNELEEYPRAKTVSGSEQKSANVLTTHWKFEPEELEKIKAVVGPKALKSDTVTIQRGYPNKSFWSLEPDEKAIAAHLVAKAGLFDEEKKDLEGVETLEALADALATNGTENRTALLAELRRAVPEGHSVQQVLIELLSPCVPKFLLFSTYDTLPGRVAIDALAAKGEAKYTQEERIFLALLGLAGTSIDAIKNSTTTEELIARIEKTQSALSTELFQFWSQNRHLRVLCQFQPARPADPAPNNTGQIFSTRIWNDLHKASINLDERSSGFIWFFSFLVWLSRIQEVHGDNLVILLDEPGLTLHGKAQGDLLRYIKERLRPKYQVIYTTHSPFMVDPDNLLLTRTVEDVVLGTEVLGTKVGDKILSSDADTLLPLFGALGLEVTQTLFVGKHVLTVEGPSDLLFLKWMSHELRARKREGLDPRWTVTPCGGIDKIWSFAALFGGKKLHVAVLVDFHHGDKNKVNELRKTKILRDGHVFSADTYAGQEEADIEDMVGRDAYVDLVNRNYSLPDTLKLPASRPQGAARLVVKEVEDRFGTLPPEYPSFDHFDPAAYLTEHGGALKHELPGLDAALDRFEKLFKDLNPLLVKWDDDEHKAAQQGR